MPRSAHGAPTRGEGGRAWPTRALDMGSLRLGGASRHRPDECPLLAVFGFIAVYTLGYSLPAPPPSSCGEKRFIGAV